ncbi:MAG: hypothetical protein JEZ12_19950 [Desulfobacterium sp.]|nr:hypothetical protein [Desulfobacterium sp.]
MCNTCNEHEHSHHHHNHPEIVQIMPAQKDLYAVYQAATPMDHAVMQSDAGLSLVPVLFLGLMKHGDKTMVEGFFASKAINSCEDVDGFKGYASSMDEAEKLYA